MKKIGEINSKSITFVIYYDEAEAYNPYKLYLKWYEYRWHRRLVSKYAHLAGCIEVINDYVRDHDEDRR